MEKVKRLGENAHGHMVYQDEEGGYWLDTNINCDAEDATVLHRPSPSNDPDGEPDYEMTDFEIINPFTEREKHEAFFKFEYMLLGRLNDDAAAFFGRPNDCRYRNEKFIWGQDIEALVSKMKEIWQRFPDDIKPAWCTWEQILEYEDKMNKQNPRYETEL